MEVIILTGLSGAGKTKCLKILEDFGFYAVDNIMPSLIPTVVQTCYEAKTPIPMNRLAISIDARGGYFFDGIYAAIDELKQSDFCPKILFLDASDEALCNRYKESRREHPLSLGGRVITGIMQERELLNKLRAMSDYYIDTTNLNGNELRQKVYNLRLAKKDAPPSVLLVSFGQKRGFPTDCDMIYDVRFLPNPYHELTLRDGIGTQAEIFNYVFADPLAESSVQTYAKLISDIIPAFIKNVKAPLIIGIGCTGGKHRSVAFAQRLHAVLSDMGIATRVEHRDMYKE